MKKVTVVLARTAYAEVDIEVEDDIDECDILELAYKKVKNEDFELSDYLTGSEEIF